MKRIFSWIWRAIKYLWSLIDASRRLAVNLIFLALIGIVAVAALHGETVTIAPRSALVLNLRGQIVEQNSDGAGQVLAHLDGDRQRQVQLRDIITVLDAAAKDERIERVLLLLDDTAGASLPALREIAAALERFKAAGKQVVAWGSRYDQKQYYLAAHASEVYLHPMGMVYIEGYGRHRNYYRDALEKLGISVHLLRVGNYKNAGEPFIANGPSQETQESDGTLYGSLWQTYTEGVEKARKLPAGALAKGIEDLPQRFANAGNDAAKLALQEKLVDGLKSMDELRQVLIERGVRDEQHHSFRQVSFDNYLATQSGKLLGDAIGVVIAEGEISEGTAGPGTIGGRSTAELIRKAREDDKIKALVLRVNSPGGSAFGSELVRRELELAQAAGKPVVVSMGGLAASGGYWISMAADEVIADPATVTGSIGVFAMLPTAEKAMEKLSVHTGGTSTTWLAGAYDPRRGLDPRLAAMIQGSVGNIYTDFLARVAKNRKTTPDKINEVAQGRVWTGLQAKERGLVDKLGGFTDAIQAAATRAHLPADARLIYLERDLSAWQKVLGQLEVRLADALARDAGLRLATLPAVMEEPRRDFAWLAEMADPAKTGVPFMGITHCLCAP